MRANVRNKNRLQLNRETLRSLSPGELEVVAGGGYSVGCALTDRSICVILVTKTLPDPVGPVSKSPGACPSMPDPQTSIVINPSAIGP